MQKKELFKGRIAKRAIAFMLSGTMILGTVNVPNGMSVAQVQAAGNFNYGEALQKSLIFYELQKSGKLDGEEYNRNNWRADSCLNDGKDNGVDLTGGWYDAGDNAKFNLPMSYTATMLGWSYLNNTDAYVRSGQEKYILNQVEWVNDYFVKCHPQKNVYYYQVGSGSGDHAYWGAAETVEARMERPSYKVDNTSANGGSAVCGQTAAALAVGSIAIKNKDAQKQETYLKHAKEIYQMAEEAKSDAGYTEANGFYNSWSGYYDELSWAAYWLYEATGDKTYLEKAVTYADYFGAEGQDSDEIKYSYTHCWDDAHIGACYVLAMCEEVETSKREKYLSTVEKNILFWNGELKGKGGDQITYTQGGLAWISQWGSIRYATTAAYLAAVYAKWDGADKDLAAKAWNFAKKQADYALGSNGQSYQIGFGENYPKNPHHRTAHGPWGDSLSKDPVETRHVLMGALVGGPQSADDSSYEDDRGNYYSNEVACDYNAGFTGLLATMYDEYGGNIDLNVNAVEKVGEEMSVEAAVNAQDSTNTINFVEIKAVVYNKSAWPARVTDKLKYRFFVDISDAIKNGAKAEDFEISANYKMYNATTLSKLKPWNEEEGIYYTEIDLSGAKIYPGGQNYYRNETQFRIKAPGKWDFSGSPSLQGLIGTSNSNMVLATNIALYDDGELVFGHEPNGKEEPGQDESGKEEPGQDESGKEEPGQDESGKEEPGQDESGKEEPEQDESGKEEPGQDESGKEEPGQDEQEKEESDTSGEKPTNPGDSITESGDDWLHTDGANILDKNGNVVRLTGANWFGFNCSEGILHGLGWGADIRDVIEQSAERGINLLRIPVSTELLLSWKNGEPIGQKTNFSNSPYYSNNPDLVNDDGTSMNSMEVFDKMMELCKEYGVKVMVDVHSPDANNSGHNYPLWYGTKNFTTQDWIDGWTWLVEKYKDDDTLIACDLKNEPHGKRDEEKFAKWDASTDENNWRYAAIKCGEEILKINPNMLIMVEGIEQTPLDGYTYEDEAIKDVTSAYLNYEGAWWGGNLRAAREYPVEWSANPDWNDQVVYSPHDYGPLVYAQTWFDKDFTEETLLEDYWYDAWAYLVEEDIAPLLIGEWGGFMDGEDNEKWMNLIADYMNKKNISHTFWCINPNSGDTGGLLDNSWKAWDEKKYALLEETLWQDASGRYVGLDHAKPLGSKGITIDEYYKDSSSDKIEVSGIALGETEKTMKIGETYLLKATITPSDATNKMIKWKSENEAVATVSNGGVVTAVKEGSAIIRAITDDGAKEAVCLISVKAVKENETEDKDQSGTGNETEDKDQTGTGNETEDKDQTGTGNETEDKDQTGTGNETEDKDQSGTGNETEDKDQTGTGNETEDKDQSGTGNETEDKDQTGTGNETEDKDQNGTGNETEDKDQTGTGNENEDKGQSGTSDKTEDKDQSSTGDKAEDKEENNTGDKAEDNTEKPGAVELDTIIINKTKTEIAVGDVLKLGYVVKPSNAEVSAVEWKSSDESVLMVDGNGNVIALKEGNAVISINAKGALNSEATDGILVNIYNKVTAIEWVDNPADTMIVGESQQLNAKIIPTNATYSALKYESDNKDVATVNANGKVTAKREGQATITVSSTKGEVTKTVNITVRAMANVTPDTNTTPDTNVTPGVNNTPQVNTNPTDKNGAESNREDSLKVGTVVKSKDACAKYKITTITNGVVEVSYAGLTDKKCFEVIIPKMVELEDGTIAKVTGIEKAALKNSKVKKVIIGTNVKIIGDNAFSNCKQLKTINIGSNVTIIGNKAFYNCQKLSNITIPGKVKKIGKKAFYECKGLKKLIIKTNYLQKKNVGSKAFGKLNAKVKIKVPKKHLKAYKTLFQAKGLKRSVEITK